MKVAQTLGSLLNMLKRSRHAEMFTFYAKFNFTSGYLPAFFSMCVLTLVTGFLPLYLLSFWTVFKSTLFEGSTLDALNISTFMAIQAIAYSVLEFSVQWYAMDLAQKQTGALTQVMGVALGNKNPDFVDNLDNLSQIMLEPKNFFDNTNQIIQRVLHSVGMLSGAMIFLMRSRLYLLNVSVFVTIVASDYVVSCFASSRSRGGSKQSMPARGADNLADLNQVAKNTSSNLRDTVDALEKDHAIVKHQPNYFRNVNYIIETQSNELAQQNARVMGFQHGLDTYTLGLQRLGVPLFGYLLITMLDLPFPLHVSASVTGVTMGVFTQLVQSYRNVIEHGSLWKNNHGNLSHLESAYNNILPFLQLYSLKLDEHKPAVLHKLDLSVVVSYSLLSAWIFTLVLAAANVITYLGLGHLSFAQIPHMGVIPLATTTIALLTLRPKALHTSMALISSGLLAVMLWMLCAHLLSHSMSLVSPITVGVYCGGGLIAWNLLAAYYSRLVKQGAVIPAVAMDPKSHSSSLSTSKTGNSIIIKGAVLLDQDSGDRCLAFSDGQQLEIKPGVPVLVHGENGAGKSSLVVSSLAKHSAQPSYYKYGLSASISGCPTKSLIFPQNSNPTFNAELFKHLFTIPEKHDGTKSILLTQSQCFCYTILFDKPSAPTYHDYKLHDAWDDLLRGISTFLDKQGLNAGLDSVLLRAMNDHVIGAKLIAAVLISYLQLVKSKRYPFGPCLLVVDEGFKKGSEMDSESIYDQLTSVVRGADNIYFLAVLHAQSLHRLFDQCSLADRCAHSNNEVTITTRLGAPNA